MRFRLIGRNGQAGVLTGILQRRIGGVFLIAYGIAWEVPKACANLVRLGLYEAAVGMVTLEVREGKSEWYVKLSQRLARNEVSAAAESQRLPRPGKSGRELSRAVKVASREKPQEPSLKPEVGPQRKVSAPSEPKRP